MMGVHMELRKLHFVVRNRSSVTTTWAPFSPIAVWAILGALRSPASDVCCWVNLQLRRPGPATSDGINRENIEGWEG